ncbi:MAG TPA: CapA family protein [Candidatus Sulfomarinibacteraceae bacterium]|nr:CapA family protein [Candidatus Sulfomarinibacteraceae bacterium]
MGFDLERHRPATRRRPNRAIVPATLLALAVVLGGCDPSTSAGPSAAAEASPGLAGPAVEAVPPSPVVAAPAPTPVPTPVPTPTVVHRPLVPVTDFRAPWTETSAGEVAAVLAGTSERYDAIEVVEAQRFKVLAALGLGLPGEGAPLIVAPDLATLRADLATSRSRLAFLVVDDIDASVRALGWEGSFLFGSERVATASDWPLQAAFTAGAGEIPVVPPVRYDPATAWTLVAGGDILLDRGVALAIRESGRGVDFPFDGGSVEITSRCRDCSAFGWDLPRTRRTGEEGAVRELLTGADLAIANFENPAPNAFRFHEHGTVFSADPALIEGLANAGLDWVSLANNHIGDAGSRGVLQTMVNLDSWGIAHGGAGANASAAHAGTLFEVRGVTVGLLGYDAIAPSYWATDSRAGSAGLSAEGLRADVAAARAAGADLVVVFPHWGVEYTTRVSAQQSRLGRAAIDAGADLVIGNHPHWAGALEIHEGKPIWYALGNFVFDQTWSEPTMEGITLELTFDGARLVQATMRPHLILDRSQPNFLDPAESGAVVMDQVWSASEGRLPW